MRFLVVLFGETISLFFGFLKFSIFKDVSHVECQLRGQKDTEILCNNLKEEVNLLDGLSRLQNFHSMTMTGKYISQVRSIDKFAMIIAFLKILR
jgi:hypothetical protein